MLTCLQILMLLVANAQDEDVPREKSTNEVQGEIVRLYLEHNEIVIEDFDGKDRTFVLAPDVIVTLNKNPARREDLKEFIFVVVRYDPAKPLPVAREVRGMGPVMFSKVPPVRSPDHGGVFADVQVFYGTDRSHGTSTGNWWKQNLRPFSWAGGIGAFTILLMAFTHFRHRKALNWVTALLMAATTAFAYHAYDDMQRSTGGTVPPEQVFGNGWGKRLEFGTCTVSIPREHQLGRLESPSLLRFEFRFNETKHVTLRDVQPLSDDQFRAALSLAVERSARKELFVFIHGYNATFSEAARRTAQLAYDLEFDGPAVFFSWPSQGELLQYTVDENNVERATPDLAKFLRLVAAESGARSIQLLAHSMGNRALCGALRTLAADQTHHSKLFREVVLAAPDVDASFFESDLFPAIKTTARRFTLYASSKDNALVASKAVHGNPRAGDSGESLLVIPGLDTIDVSSVDTSLLGHTYYGDSKSIITDLEHVVKRGEPPPQRPWLRPAQRNSLSYWLFQPRILD